jgi:fructosamine-3-kinase
LTEFVKRNAAAPPGLFACEATGLAWLAAAPGGVPCAQVLGWDEVSLTLRRLPIAAPTAKAAHGFGRRLAFTHDAGADGFGAAPDGWAGPGFFGPTLHPLPMSLIPHDSWGRFYADERLSPMLGNAAGALPPRTLELVDQVMSRCRAADFDDPDPPARLHGDLWSGNVIWTPEGAALIDPAAHGGHRETDLAALELFGCPFLDEILAGYQSIRPLRPGWRDRIGLHQLYILLAHVALFGGGYANRVAGAARAALMSARS